MERINIPASLQNLSQVGKVQTQHHNAPTMQALQNQEIDLKKTDERSEKPNEVDEAENLIVDPDDRRKQEQQKGKKRKKKTKPDRENRGPESGHFVDYSA